MNESGEREGRVRTPGRLNARGERQREEVTCARAIACCWFGISARVRVDAALVSRRLRFAVRELLISVLGRVQELEFARGKFGRFSFLVRPFSEERCTRRVFWVYPFINHEQQPHRRAVVSVAPRGEAALTAFFFYRHSKTRGRNINLKRRKERGGGGRYPPSWTLRSDAPARAA
jgi:hypothetical protein